MKSIQTQPPYFTEDGDTESLRESLDSTDHDMDYDVSEATDISEVQTSYAENHKPAGPGEIVLMEHDDLEGTIAVYSPKRSISYENIGKLSFKPELREITDDLDISEVITEHIETDSEPDMDDDDCNSTDEEDVSGVDCMAGEVIKYPEIELPKVDARTFCCVVI